MEVSDVNGNGTGEESEPAGGGASGREVVVGQTRNGVVERKGPAGRRTLLTPVVIEAIEAGVRKGLGAEQAGEVLGIDAQTVYEWLARGEGRHSQRPAAPIYAEFAERIRRAEAQNEAAKLDILTRAGEGGIVLTERTITFKDGREVHEKVYSKPEWQAAAWYLERKYPDRYGRRERWDMRQMMMEVMKRIAAEQGLDESEVIAEAQRLVGEKGSGAVG